jgi:hypothetical protein
MGHSAVRRRRTGTQTITREAFDRWEREAAERVAREAAESGPRVSGGYKLLSAELEHPTETPYGRGEE